MRRMYLVLTVAALMAAMIIFAAPAMADDNRHENRIDRIEDRLENHGFDVDLDEGDLLLVSPFVFGIDAFDVGDDEVDVDIDFDRDGLIDVDVDV